MVRFQSANYHWTYSFFIECIHSIIEVMKCNLNLSLLTTRWTYILYKLEHYEVIFIPLIYSKWKLTETSHTAQQPAPIKNMQCDLDERIDSLIRWIASHESLFDMKYMYTHYVSWSSFITHNTILCTYEPNQICANAMNHDEYVCCRALVEPICPNSFTQYNLHQSLSNIKKNVRATICENNTRDNLPKMNIVHIVCCSHSWIRMWKFNKHNYY